MAKIKITQKRSVIGCPQDQRRTVRSLGLRKIGQSVTHEDSPSLRGMVSKVRHIVEVEPYRSEAEEEGAS